MNRILVFSLVGALIVAGIVVGVSVAGGGSTDSPDDAGPAAHPSTTAGDTDPFDFDAGDLDPEFVYEDAEIHLTCGQLLGEAQVASFLDEPIEASEYTLGEHLDGGYHLVCKFWSDTIAINYVQLEYWNGNDTIAFCEEGTPESFGMTRDAAGPADSFYESSSATSAQYQVCFPTARLDITSFSDVDAGKTPKSQADLRALAQFYAANLDMFDRAARTF